MSLESRSARELVSLGPIAAAALRYKGEIFIGHMHADAFADLCAAHPEAGDGSSEIESGFITTKGEWVTRNETLFIAEVYGQQKESSVPYADGTVFPITSHEIIFWERKEK